MRGAVKYKEMLALVSEMLITLPEHRSGENRHYELRDAGMSAFSVFRMQLPSFLSWQQDMDKRRRRSVTRSLFGIERIPSVGQNKNLLNR